MTFAPFTFEQHRKFLLDTLRRKLPRADLRPGSFWHIWAQGQARGLAGITSALTHGLRQVLPDTAVALDLDHHASVYDLPRQKPRRATGVVQCTVTADYTSAPGLHLRDVAGRRYDFDEFKRDFPGIFELQVLAALPGEKGNKDAETLLTFFDDAGQPVTDGALDPSAMVMEPGLVRGRDLETDPKLSTRIVETLSAGRLRDGLDDYVGWAEFEEGGRALPGRPSREPALYEVDGDFYQISQVFVHQDPEARNRVYMLPLLAPPERIGPLGLNQAVFNSVSAKLPVTVDLIVPLIREEAIDVVLYVEPKLEARWDWGGAKKVSTESDSDREIILFRHVGDDDLIDPTDPDDPNLDQDGADGLEAGMRVLINGEQRVIGHVDHDADKIILTEALSKIPKTGAITDPDTTTMVFPGGPITAPVQAAVRTLFDALGPLHKSFLPSAEERNVLPAVIVDTVMEVDGVYDVRLDEEGLESVLNSVLFSVPAYGEGTLACMAVAGEITVAPIAAL